MTITYDMEYRAFERLVESAFPTLTVRPFAPKEPKANDVVFQLFEGAGEELNRAVVAKERPYQLLFYASPDYIDTAMALHSKVDVLLTQASSVPCSNGRHIKINSHVMSRIFQSDSGIFCFYAIIEGSYNVSRTFDPVDKMMHIGATITQITTDIKPRFRSK